MPGKEGDERLRREFNEWAAAGQGPKMERHHLNIAEQAIRRMALKPGERVLDLGCGTGWASRIVARLVATGPAGFGQVVGLDISDEMIARAREASTDFENLLFVWGSAEKIPWEENYFDKVLSIEAFYYYPDQERVISELFRVMAPRGRLYILINLYRDSPYGVRWAERLKVPVHIRSAQEYEEMLKRHTFEEVETCLIPDETPTPDDYKSELFTAEEMRELRRMGALLISARKPNFRTPPRGMEVY